LASYYFEDLINIFSPKLFSDCVNSQNGTTSESGTGIGLMLSEEFEDSLGAEILGESEVGVGTTCRVVLKGET
jgi:signal transduction histidine kinase